MSKKENPYTKSVLLRMPQDMHDVLRELSYRVGKTMNQIILEIISTGVLEWWQREQLDEILSEEWKKVLGLKDIEKQKQFLLNKLQKSKDIIEETGKGQKER